MKHSTSKLKLLVLFTLLVCCVPNVATGQSAAEGRRQYKKDVVSTHIMLSVETKVTVVGGKIKASASFPGTCNNVQWKRFGVQDYPYGLEDTKCTPGQKEEHLNGIAVIRGKFTAKKPGLQTYKVCYLSTCKNFQVGVIDLDALQKVIDTQEHFNKKLQALQGQVNEQQREIAALKARPQPQSLDSTTAQAAAPEEAEKENVRDVEILAGLVILPDRDETTRDSLGWQLQPSLHINKNLRGVVTFQRITQSLFMEENQLVTGGPPIDQDVKVVNHLLTVGVEWYPLSTPWVEAGFGLHAGGVEYLQPTEPVTQVTQDEGDRVQWYNAHHRVAPVAGVSAKIKLNIGALVVSPEFRLDTNLTSLHVGAAKDPDQGKRFSLYPTFIFNLGWGTTK